mmetsp:Transcript_39394/g.103955  ORF Transcript_39394/g.103955 Transcript_39394/m.103955 type:complete len:137 (-) Transcript_39394:628-1038(-)
MPPAGAPPSPPSPQHAPAAAGSPVDRLPPGAAHRRAMQSTAGSIKPPPSPSAGGGFGGGFGSGSPSPQLFSKGSFAARKLEATRDAFGGSDDGPLSGRSSSRSPGRSNMGQYASFASRLHSAESQRSQRSARSYRG